MKHGTICKIGNDLFDYSGKTKQGYLRGRNLVEVKFGEGRHIWNCPSKDGNVINYMTTEFELATPEEIEIFNKAIKK